MRNKKVKIGELVIFDDITYIDDNVEIMNALQASQPIIFQELINSLIISTIEFNGSYYPTEHWPLIKCIQQIDPNKKMTIAITGKAKTQSELQQAIYSNLFLTLLLPNEKNMMAVHQDDLIAALNYPYSLTYRQYADVYHCDHTIFSTAKNNFNARKQAKSPIRDPVYIPPQADDDDIDF